jgi:riboflavin synthase
MFTGIIEAMGKVISIEKDGDNIHFEIESDLAPQLKIDQSISHSGVCLTVVSVSDNSYKVTAIKETLDKTNMGELSTGSLVNLERAMKLGERLDGHIVQGHVDQTAKCIKIDELDGSWVYMFSYNHQAGNITIEKGSITVNGVSLTVVNSKEGQFSVAIIPYTYENTNFKQIKAGSGVNLEFDVVGKYIQKLIGQHYSL